MLLQNNFLPTILLPTRVTSHTCTLIDHIYFSTSKHRDQFLSGNLLTDMSDHFANFFLLYSNKKNDKKEKRPMVRLFSEKNSHVVYGMGQELLF